MIDTLSNPLLTTVAAAAEYAGKLVTGQGFVTKYKPAAKSYAKQFNSEVLPQVARCSEKFEEQIQKVIYAHDIEVTLKAAGLSYVLYKITSWFSLYTLVFAGVVLTFTLPAVYVHNKKEIDAAVTQYTKLAKDKASELSAAAHKKAGPHFDTLVKKTGPLGSFINSKIPVRTAGSTVGTETNGYKEPTSAHTTGASKFPEVPSSADDSILDEFDDAADTSKVEVPVRL
ncbi:hypothetical protein PGUG_00829 [Meyerozyma guilliermondii ATCC 6260]|uniref:Reticulon-like protein n=1 Tax=Meyerozyma guilliermondii (strain ATCC 6260 / CBS 566 / DSM 6381 / JCM 1539 / NBRC 10279 / NRRL Y-324) TaxID=294746 RepID=A5DC24_PICGU|nr:uncharacterized protein PGUG_00829 [Meyerozyma guilliermondii ATCC 6260]EDK36731.2 hypothetical protein PGUG_00829 [Meyerozyma guilliermondii ATCC 6260]